MNNHKRILVFSIVVMAGGMLCAAAVAIVTLYRTAFEEERIHLAEIARGRARFMEAIVRHDGRHDQLCNHKLSLLSPTAQGGAVPATTLRCRISTE